MPIFENKGKRYNIPDDKVSSFRKSFPDAQVYYNNGGKSYKIPVSKADAFVKSFPKASYASLGEISNTKPASPSGGNEQKLSADSLQKLKSVVGDINLDAPVKRQVSSTPAVKPTASESTNVVRHNGMKGEDVWKIQEKKRLQEEKKKKEIAAQKNKIPGIDAKIASIEKEIADRRRKGGEYVISSPTTGVSWTGTTDKDIDALEASLAQLQQQKNKIEAAANEGGVGQSFKDVFTDPDVLTLGLSGSKDAGVMLRIKKKLDNGEALTDAEKGLMQHYQDNAITQQEMDPYLTNGYRFGNIAFRSVPFMVEIGLSNPMTSGIKVGTRKAASYVAKKGIENGFKKSAIKALGTTVDDLAAAAVTSNTTQLGHLAQSYQQNRTGQAVVSQDENGNPVYSFEGGKGMLESAYRAETSQLIENYTERLGEHLGAPGKWLKGKINASRKPFVQGLSNTLKKATASDAYQAINNGLKKVGFHGFVPEVLEEEAGIPLDYVFLGEGPETWEEAGRQQLDILGGIGLSCGMLSSLQFAATGGANMYTGQQYRKAKKQLHNADNVASFRLTEDRWEPIREQLDGATNEEIVDVADGILSDPELHAQERNAIIDYTRKLLFYRGFNMGTVAAENEGLVSPEENEANKAYVEGNNATEPQDMNAAKILLDDARKKAEDVLASLHLYDDSPIEALKFVNNNTDLYNEQERRTVLDYINAKSRYEGMLDRVADDVDSKIDISNRTIERRANTDGMIHPVVDQTGETRYLVSGHVETDEDGNVIRQGSDGSLIVVDEDGKLEMVSAETLSSVEEPINAEEEKKTAAETIRQEALTSAQASIDGITPFERGATISIIDDAGYEREVTVAGTDEEGNIVTNNGTFLPDVLQNMKDRFTQKQVLQQHEEEQAEEEAEEGQEAASFYGLGDTVVLDINGTPVNAEVTKELDDNGNYGIHLEQPIGRKQNIILSPEQIASMLHHEEAAPVEETPAGESPAPGAPAASTEASAAPEQPAVDGTLPEQPTAPELPRDKDGNLIYHEVPVEETIADIYADFDTKEAGEFINANLEDSQKAVEKITSRPPKMTSNKAKYLSDKKKWNEALADAQKKLDYWSSVRDENSKITSQDADNTNQDADDSEPLDANEYIASLLGTSIKITPDSYRKETGYGAAEQRNMIGSIASAGNGGVSIERAAEIIEESGELAKYGFQGDTNDVRSAIIEILQDGNPRGYASRRQEERNREEKEREMRELDTFANEEYHMSGEDFLAYEENFIPNVIHNTKDFDDSGYYNQLASDKEKELEENGRQEIGGHDSSGEIPVHDKGSAILQTVQPADNEGASDAAVGRQGSDIHGDSALHNQDGTETEHGKPGAGTSIAEADETDLTEDEKVLRDRTTILEDKEYEVDGENGKVYHQPIAISGKDGKSSVEIEKVDEPDEKGNYTGSYYLYAGKQYGSLYEAVEHIDKTDSSSSEDKQESVSGNPDVTVAAAEGEVNTDPTEAQKAAGNYKKGHLKLDGYEISIENPKGSERSGKDKDGKEWHTTMHNTYGYIRGTEGVDGDHIDVYLSDEPSQGDVFVVDQVNDDGSFDEHKVMYGFNSEEEARQAYLSNYQEGWQGLGNITQVSREDFKKWVDSSHRKTKPFAEYSTTKRRKRGGFFSLKEGAAEQPAVDADQEIQSKFEEEKAKFANDNPKTNNYAAALQQASNVQEAVDALKDNISSLVAEYKDWAGRKYKKNSTGIEVGNDELSSTHTTIGTANERRRQNRMEGALRGIEEIEGHIKTLLERSGVPESEHSKYYDGASVRQEINGGPTANETAPANGTTVEDEEKLRIESKAPSHVNKDGYVSDAAGVPVVLYHGTENADVKSASQLEPGHKRVDGEKATFNGDGIFLTPDRSVAEDYAGANGHVLETKVKLKKPFVSYGVLGMNEKEAAEYTDKLKAEGYDGILNYASPKMREMGAMPNEVIVFDKGSIEEESAPADAPVAEESGSYVYRLRLRPFGIGSQPDGGKYVDDGSQFGAVEYDHKLTPEQIDNYSMMPITEAKQLEGKTFAKPFGKFDDIMFHVTSVDENGNVTYETQYKDNKDTETLDYIHFMERLGKKAKEVKQEEKVQEPQEAQPAEKESSYPAGMSNDQTNGLERISRESVAYFKNYFDNWTGEIVTNENSTMNKGKVIETGPAVQLTFDNDGAVSYQTIYGDVDSIKAWIEDYASKHGGKKKAPAKKPASKPKKINLKNYVAKKSENRPATNGILHKDGKAYATDGMVLVAVPDKYDSSLEGKVTTVKGEPMSEEYPNVSHLTEATYGTPKDVDYAHVGSQLSDILESIEKEFPQEVSSERMRHAAEIQFGKKKVRLTYDNAVRFFEAAEQVGAKQVDISGEGTRIIRAKGDKGEVYVVATDNGTPSPMTAYWDPITLKEEFGERVVLKNAKFPKDVELSDIVTKQQAGAKRASAENVYATFVGDDLYIKRFKRGDKIHNVELMVPNATQYTASEIAFRLELGVGTSTDAIRLMNDAIMELYHKKGLGISVMGHLKTVRFSIGTDISQNQSPAEQLTTQAVLTALDKANVPVVVVSEDELKSLGGKAQLSKKQKRLLDAATMERDSILSNPATDTSEQSQPIESSTNDTITDSKDIANVQKELDSLAKSWLNKPNRTKGVISDLTLALGLENENDGPSRYKTFRLGNGELVTFRLSNHNSSVENFDNKGEAEGVSLVISRYNNKNIKNNGIAHVTEHFYSKTELEKAEGNPVSAIISSISDFLNTGRYVDTTGLAQREEVNIPERLAKADGTVYGAAYNGKIYLNQDFINPETPIHEYTHLWANAMQQSNPECWESVKELLRDTPVWNAVVNDPHYANIKDNEDEVASEALSRISGKQNAARMVAEAREMLDGADVFGKAETIGLLNRMKNALQKFWNWVGKELFNIKKFDSVEEVTDRIMYDLVNGTNLGNTADSKARLHFIGTHGAYNIDQHDKAVNRLENYEVARKMEDAGEDASGIKMATGWERGADGKWRYEIHDFDRFNHVGNIQFILSHPEIDREVELNIKSNKSVFFGTEPLTEEEREELDQLHEKTKQLDLKALHKNVRDLKLLDFVQDEDLFTAYPQMKHTFVSFAEMDDDTGGYVHTLPLGIKEIVINKSLYDEAQGMSVAAQNRLESIFLHEVQHLIQAEEGFARGGSQETVEQVKKEILEILNPDKTYPWGVIVEGIKAGYITPDQKTRLNMMASEYGYDNVSDFLDGLEPYSFYRRLGGEVEARNVQTRMNMDMDERKETLAEETEDIFRGDQIFIANAYGEYEEKAPAKQKKSLVGVHNISDDKLCKALKLGGLANPSVAVINSDTQSHEDFGGISLILPSKMIDGQKTYTSDAWTPTYPNVVNVFTEKGAKKLYDRVDKVVTEKELNRQARLYLRNFIEDGSTPDLKYMFLKEKGYDIPIVTKKYKKMDIEYPDFLNMIGAKEDMSTAEMYDAYKQLPKETKDEVTKWVHASGSKAKLDRINTVLAEGKRKSLINMWNPDKGLSELAFNTFIENLKNSGVDTGEVDTYAVDEIVRGHFNEDNLYDEYYRWIDSLADYADAKQKIYLGFDNSGRKKYLPYTLQNVSKVMNKQSDTNAYGNTGFSATRAAIVDQMTTLGQIRSNKDKLITDENYDEKHKALEDQFMTIVKSMADMQKYSDNYFKNLDFANWQLQAALPKTKPLKHLRECGFSIADNSELGETITDFKEQLVALPSKYFETKFKRPVLFDEFSAAVVPSSTDDEIKQALKAQGLTVVEYDEKVDGSRQDAFDKAIHQDEGILFRKVEDPSEIMWLENQPHEKAYRAMQVIDGKLYPPMAASVNGKLVESRNLGEWEKADERPEMAVPVIDKKTGKQKVDKKTGEPVWTFKLDKGGKDATGKTATSVPARYNPYWHSSRSPLNDQFKSAWIRPNLVTVEVEIPSSELTSGYKAERAKDAVGEVEWKSGAVSGKLAKQGHPRRVILSRWDKPVRILSNEEVAQKIADLVLDAGISIPENVVTPQVRVELEKLGVKIGAPEKGAKKDEQIQEAMERGLLVDNTVTGSTPEAVSSPADAVQELAATLNVSPTVIESTKELEGDKKYAKGWYDSKTGNIVVVLPNNRDAEDAKVTLLHEAVAHHGLRKMFGEHFNDFLENVFTHASEPVRRKIVDLARKNKYDFHVAIEEYLASLAETTDFENAQQQGWWNKIKQLFFKMLEKVGAKIPALSDNELRYILWRSYQNLKQKSDNSDLFALAQNVSKEYELKVGEYADMDVRKAREADDRSIDSIIAQAKADGTYMKAPNGKPTNLDERQWAQVRTKAFKEWFGDWEKDPENASKVVDENGEPKVVYHGTRNNFTQFDLERSGSNLDYGTAGYGFYFTEDIQNASNIARNSENNGEPKVMEVFLNIKNPLEGVSLTELDGSRKKAIRFTEKAKINGHDGISASRFGLKWHVAFEPTQIKSATENDGLFDPHDPDIRFRMSKPAGPAASDYNEAVRVPNEGKTVGTYENLGNRLREAYQDSMLSLKRLQEAVANETDSEIEDFENAYTAENRMSSENKAETEAYKHKFMNPLFEEVSKLTGKSGTTLDDVNNYLMAKHGLERNVYMREKAAQEVADRWEANTVKKEMKDGKSKEEAEQIAADGKDEVYQKKLDSLQDTDYSGLTELTQEEGEDKNDEFTERAETLVELFESKHDVTGLWEKINAATKESLRKSYKSGMLSKENYEYIRDMFENYVPLRGWDNNEAGKEYDYLSNNRMRLSPAVVRMKGRKSKADNVLAFIGFSGESSIIQGNRNLMKQHLLNMAENHPTQLATVSKQWFVLDNATGDWMEAYPEFPENATPEQVNIMVQDFEERMQELKKNGLAKQGKVKLSTGMHIKRSEMPEHTVKVLRNGQELNIYINGSPRAAQAVNGLLNPDNVGNTTVHRWAQAVKHFMARNFTSQNPAFVFSNLARDVIWAGNAVNMKEPKPYRRQYRSNVRKILLTWKTIPLLKKFEKGTLDEGNEFERYFKEFLMHGGETGFTAVNTVENYKRDIKRYVEEAQKGVKLPKKAWRKFWDGIEFVNRSVEDISRFAVYMTSRQMGRTVERSIWDAKEITVNFNKKGSGDFGARYMNFAYVFFNAAVQSVANFAKLAYNHPAGMGKTIGKFVAYGMLLPAYSILASTMMGGDDDEDAYFDLPKWVRENNLVLYVPFSERTFVTIPLPHELRPYYAIGENALCTMMGKEEPLDAVQNAALSFTSMFPLDLTGHGGNELLNFTPTAVLPLAEIAANKDFFGKPVYRDTPFNQLNPEWTRAYQGTSPYLVQGTKILNSLGGGNDVDKGYWATDINPAKIEHLFEGYLGGMGKFINRTANFMSMAWDEDARMMRNVPIASSFVQDADPRFAGSTAHNTYYERKEELEEMRHKISGYKNEMKKADAQGDQEKYEKYSELLDAFYDTYGERYATIRSYSKSIDKLRKAKEYLGKDEQKKIDSQISALQKELEAELEKLGTE